MIAAGFRVKSGFGDCRDARGTGLRADRGGAAGDRDERSLHVPETRQPYHDGFYHTEEDPREDRAAREDCHPMRNAIGRRAAERHAGRVRAGLIPSAASSIRRRWQPAHSRPRAPRGGCSARCSKRRCAPRGVRLPGDCREAIGGGSRSGLAPAATGDRADAGTARASRSAGRGGPTRRRRPRQPGCL